MKTKLFCVAASMAAAVAFAQKPKQVIMYIGDGYGTSSKVAARMAMGQGTEGKRVTSDANFHVLAIDKLKYQGSLTTHSLNSWITDSGPGASCYAAGEAGKLDNEAISFNVGKGESVQTILEKAKKAGYAVGLITTTRITHATPATFGSHIWFRDLEDYIAAQYISTTQQEYEDIFNNSAIKPYNEGRDWILPEPKKGVEIDVLLGGGARHFLPKGYSDPYLDSKGNPIMDKNGKAVAQAGRRVDNVNLVEVAKQRGYSYVNSRDALMNLDLSKFKSDNNAKLLGLFNASHVNYEQDRQMNADWEPSLPEMTEMAIKVLQAKGGKKGFFLMVEGGRIDHLEHANSGGISVISDNGKNVYTVDANKPSYMGGGEAVYRATPDTPRHTDVFGSDYMIKEVLAFDYAIAQGRKLLADNTAETLIFSSSDHECGGVAIVGLNDAANVQNNGTYIRTYAMGPRQNGANASSGGAATATTVANPAGVKRGDIDFGTTSPNGWYPNYTNYIFQNRTEEPWPKVDINGRRIVIAYASNPLTNGNGNLAGGTPGNHTPMDVFVGAEDNVQGDFARRITGKGQLDNTYLTQIMADFLQVGALSAKEAKAESPDAVGKVSVYPNPATSSATLDINLKKPSTVAVSVYDMSGKLVTAVAEGRNAQSHKIEISTQALTSGSYVVNVKCDAGSFSTKLIKK